MHVWCHRSEQLSELRPSFTRERKFGKYVRYLLGCANIFDKIPKSRLILSNNQPRFTRWVRKISLMDGPQPFMIILITASLSSKTNKDALRLEICVFGKKLIKLSVNLLSAMGVRFHWFGVTHGISPRSSNTSVTMSHKLSARVRSNLRPAPDEIIFCIGVAVWHSCLLLANPACWN